MPETYNGVTVPLSTDAADGPKLAKDMVDTLTNSTALVALLAALIPAGTIRASITAADEVGWARMGTTITNGQTLTPSLWAIVPVAWRSGANIVLPDWSNRGLIGAGAIALNALGGANSRALVAANLPPHAHGHAHVHDLANHQHDATHGHGTGLTDVRGDHAHGWGALPVFYAAGAEGIRLDLWDGGNDAGFYALAGGMPTDGAHSHNVTIPTANISTGGPSVGNSGAASVTSTDNGPGTGAALDTTPASAGVIYKIKAH